MLTSPDNSAEFPQYVLVDLSASCNSKCTMCPTQLNPLRKKMIDSRLFESIVEQASEFPVSPSLFHIGVHGEPLLDQRLAEKVALCTSRGIKTVTIATNGSLLTALRARELLEARPHTIIVSLESMDSALFESIRKGLRHEVIVENLKSLLAIRNEVNSSTRIAVRFVVSSRNEHELQSFKEYWSPYLNSGKEDYFSIDPMHNWGCGDPARFHGSSPCPHVACTTILSDGNVVFCCLDHEAVHLLGNLGDQPLVGIFNSEKARRIRAIHLAGQRHTMKKCMTCDAAELWRINPVHLINNDPVASESVAKKQAKRGFFKRLFG